MEVKDNYLDLVMEVMDNYLKEKFAFLCFYG